MRIATWGAGLLGLTLANGAFAADCAAPYTSDQLLTDLPTVEDFLRNGDDKPAAKAAAELEQHLACLSEVLPPMIIGRTYRAVAGGLYVGGNLERAQDWFFTALVVDPTFDYGTEDLAPNHPVILVYQDARRVGSDDPAPVEGGKTFVPGNHYLDGRKISKPAAEPGQPHLYQWEQGGSVKTWIIEGNAFPADALAAPVVAAATTDDAKKAKAPKEKAAKPPKETPPPKEKEAVAKAPKEKAPEPEPAEPVAAADPAPEKTAKAPKEEKAPKEKAPAPAKTKTTASTSGGVTVVQRQRPPEKTPLMIGGAAVMVGGGVMYYLSGRSEEQFWNSNDEAEIDALRARTNRLVVMSGAVFAVGLGTTTWGVILDGGTPIPTVNVRF